MSTHKTKVVYVDPMMWKRSPFQIFILILTMASGVPIIFGLSDNMIIKIMEEQSFFGLPVSFFWGSFLSFGGLLTLIGSFWPKISTGMLIERSGLIVLAGASLLWASLVLWRVGWDGVYSGFLTIGFAFACAAQIRYIEKSIHNILKSLEVKKG